MEPGDHGDQGLILKRAGSQDPPYAEAHRTYWQTPSARNDHLPAHGFRKLLSDVCSVFSRQLLTDSKYCRGSTGDLNF